MARGFKVNDGMRAPEILTAAEAAIDAGLRVLLTAGFRDDGRCGCGKDCAKPGKHPVGEFFPHGAKSATQDKALIRKALKRCPHSNLAFATQGLTVVDVDGPEGEEAVKALRFPKTVRVRTSRGAHYYFHGEIRGGSFKGDEIDVISGASRYVIAPPSRRADGRNYRFAYNSADATAPIPKSVLGLKAGPRLEKDLPKTERKHIQEGERNDFLFRLACSLRRRVPDEMTILEMAKVANQRLCDAPLPNIELKALLQSSSRYKDANEGELFGPIIDREAAPMEWLYYPYLPRFGLTILAGNPGRGKSLLITLLVALVSQGADMPLSKEKPTGRRVLILSAEDNWKRQTLPRLLKNGADLDNIHHMYKVRALTDDVFDQLAKEIEEWKPDLVVIDTLSAYMGSARDMHRQNEVGEFLQRLTEIAESVGCAILGLAHLNKQSGEDPLYRIVGSIGFVASVRSALFLGVDPDEPEMVALAHGKANGGPLGKTILFEKDGGGKTDIPILKAVRHSEATHHDVCRPPKAPVGRPDTATQRAEKFILTAVAESEEPQSWEKIESQAKAAGIASASTLADVRTKLAKAGKIRQLGRGRKAVWSKGIGWQRPEE